MEDLNRAEMPRGIDDPHVILMWSADEAAPIAMFFILGFIIGQVLICLVLGFVAVKYYRRFRDGKQDGFFLHAVYWYGLVPCRGYAFKNPFIRRWFP